MNTLLKYDRKDKEYRLIDLTTGAIVATAPSGKDNKAMLETRQLKLEAKLSGINPDWLLGEISRRVRQHSAIQGRVFRAAQILATGGVRHNGGPGRYYVDSQSGKGTYTVLNNGRRACQCVDYENGQVGHQYGAPQVDGAPGCKHLLATDLLEELERRQRDAALPAQSSNRGRNKLFKS